VQEESYALGVYTDPLDGIIKGPTTKLAVLPTGFIIPLRKYTTQEFQEWLSQNDPLTVRHPVYGYFLDMRYVNDVMRFLQYVEAHRFYWENDPSLRMNQLPYDRDLERQMYDFHIPLAVEWVLDTDEPHKNFWRYKRK